jgi:hypothetical protein
MGVPSTQRRRPAGFDLRISSEVGVRAADDASRRTLLFYRKAREGFAKNAKRLKTLLCGVSGFGP